MVEMKPLEIHLTLMNLRWLPTVQPIFGHFSDTSTIMNISYFFQLDMRIEQHWNI